MRTPHLKAQAAVVFVAALSWWFVAVDKGGNRHTFGPFKTEKECSAKAHIESITDRWVAVTACEEK